MPENKFLKVNYKNNYQMLNTTEYSSHKPFIPIRQNKRLSTPFPNKHMSIPEARVSIKNKMPPKLSNRYEKQLIQSHDNGKPVGRFQLTTNLV
ncbi:hypothetical protein CEXT_694551 [Caerostris extrusa]|uniref:Uncharacterized protein n=1 Tax=Caerostris extrusa TaxID=172846 RepID=A0AAV4TY40_CAEEX|nr:hypothetical protein CEXT_694551 [Caerostris extrusa]